MSKLYYTMREGDYFYEQLGARMVSGTVKYRRTLTIKDSQLQRIQYGLKGIDSYKKIIGALGERGQLQSLA